MRHGTSILYLAGPNLPALMQITLVNLLYCVCCMCIVFNFIVYILQIFLTPKYLTDHPEDVELVEKLKSCLDEQVYSCNHCLFHFMLCPFRHRFVAKDWTFTAAVSQPAYKDYIKNWKRCTRQCVVLQELARYLLL